MRIALSSGWSRSKLAHAAMRLGPCVFALSCSSSQNAAPSDAGSASDVGVTLADGGTGDDGGAGGLASGDGASGTSATGSAGGGTTSSAGSSAASSGSPTALLRFANWAPDAPAIDVCIAPHGTGSFEGPLVANLAAQTSSPTTSLSFPLVSAYVYVAPGAYDVRFVVAGAGNCATGITSDATMLAAVPAKGAATIALMGVANVNGGTDPALRVTLLRDELVSSSLLMRFINAAPALESAYVSIDGHPALFGNIVFGAASAAQDEADGASPRADSDGYIIVAAADAGATSVTVSVASGPSDAGVVVSSSAVTALPGTVMTVALVGDTSSGIAPQLLECIDNAGLSGSLSCCGSATQGAPCSQ